MITHHQLKAYHGIKLLLVALEPLRELRLTRHVIDNLRSLLRDKRRWRRLKKWRTLAERRRKLRRLQNGGGSDRDLCNRGQRRGRDLGDLSRGRMNLRVLMHVYLIWWLIEL